MAKFAKLDSSNIVIDVNTINDSDCNGGTFPGSETSGIQFLTNLTGHSNWKQTSPDGSFRKKYAGIGMTYDSDADAFTRPKTYSTWVLNQTTWEWEPPTAKPTLTQEQIDNGSYYSWNADTEDWSLVE